MKKLLFMFIVASLNSYALEIDEKLTMRILKTSDTKKTVLINRGIEDGLAEGDHAKFFNTAGVVARAVVVKVSPTRSVWAIYRLVDADSLATDTVMNLKISSPVKTTEDDSKMITKEPDVKVAVAKGDSKIDIPLAEGAEDLDAGSMKDDDRDEMSSVMNMPVENRNIINRNLEIFGMLNVTSLGGNSTPASGAGAIKANYSALNLMAGGEYYFKHENSWYTRFSFFPFLNYSQTEMGSSIGYIVSSTVMELGAGVNWYPFSRPSEAMKFIPFLTTSIGTGSYSSKSENVSTTSTTAVDHSGALSTFSLGAGVKYYLSNGFGARATLDYHLRSSTLEAVPGTNNVSYDIAQSGFRVFFGLGYRF